MDRPCARTVSPGIERVRQRVYREDRRVRGGYRPDHLYLPVSLREIGGKLPDETVIFVTAHAPRSLPSVVVRLFDNVF